MLPGQSGVLGSVDVEQFGTAHTNDDAAGTHFACQCVEGKFFFLPLRFNGGPRNRWQQKRKPHASGLRGPNGPRAVAARSHDPMKQRRRHERHVAREKQHRVGARGLQRGEDAAERTATRHDIAPEDAHRAAQFPRDATDAGQHGVSTQFQTGFVTTQAGAEAAGENANFQVHEQRETKVSGGKQPR